MFVFLNCVRIVLTCLAYACIALSSAGMDVVYRAVRCWALLIYVLCVGLAWVVSAVMIFLCFRVIASKCCVRDSADWKGLVGYVGVWFVSVCLC